MSMDTYDKTNTSAWPDWAALPEAYKIEDGVLYGEQNGKKIRVTSTPMYISTIADTASGAKRIEITFAKNMQQEAENVPVMLSYEDYGDPSALRTKLAHYGCNANANNIRAIMTYLDDFELLNRERIPKSRIVERFGWADDTHFCPGADTGYVRDFHAHGDFDAYVGAIHPAGSAGDWNRQMQQWRHASPVFRFILAAAFAAPLLSRLSKPNYMIHIWGLSGCGKSAAVKAALSVWGDPEKLLKSYNTTRYAATQQAYIYNDLPIGLDELGEADKLDSQKLAYSLVNGTGRQQGGKGGGVRETQSWSTVVLSTGEMGIFEDNTMDGVLNRIIELVETPFPGTAEGKAEGIRVHEFLEANYGTAGTQYITGLLACDKHKLLEIYSQFSDTLKQRYGDKLQGRYLTSLVCNAMGDYLSSQYVFGETELEALRGSMDAVYHIADGVIEARPMETNRAALLYMADWLAGNANRIAVNRYKPTVYTAPSEYSSIIGYLNTNGDSGNFENEYYLLGSQFDQAVKKGGFSPSKTRQYLKTAGVCEVDGSGKTSVVKYINGESRRVICIRAKRLEDMIA
jgi:putative DNA primase/helicase